MRLTGLKVTNFRSIKDLGPIRISPLQALVGENNSGKSNILRAIQCFLTAGAGGMEVDDFNDPSHPCIIECEFSELTDDEKRHLRPYLLGDRLILRKELFIDQSRGRESVKAEYHGYQAEPRDTHLSIKKIEEAHGNRPNWRQIAERADILDYVQDAQGRVTKASYKAGLEKYLAEHVVEYDEPELGQTQALGIAQNLLSVLPEYHPLNAITDYSDEIDRRSSSTVFRRLVGELADRIMKTDTRYQELEQAIGYIHSFLNPSSNSQNDTRLEALKRAESDLCETLTKLMPTVKSVQLGVEIDKPKDIFSKGVNIKIDDGVLTDVIDKGHGLQRSLVFSLLQMYISSKREDGVGRSMILGIEEPELYIHPHCQRLIYNVLREFAGVSDENGEASGSDQVIYTTHSPAFIDIWRYDSIGIVRKPNLDQGTKVHQADPQTLETENDRKTFKLLTSFGLKHNEAFFGRYSILVEGPEDEIAVIATARKLGIIKDLPDEIGLSIIVTGSKGEIPKFQKILSAFGLEYGVMFELDGRDVTDKQNKSILDGVQNNRVAAIPNRLEDLVGVGRHFDDQLHAKRFFSNPENINPEFEAMVRSILTDIT